MDLSTTYLGLNLRNPLVASASPLTKKVEHARHLEDAGVSAVVMYSLFEEQIIHESRELDFYLSRGTETFSESLTYLPDVGTYSLAPDIYLKDLEQLKKNLSIPVIGSLNGVSTGGWIKYAKRIQDAGADALELNIYYIPIDPEITSTELEDAYVALVRDIRAEISIPIAVKLSPFFTALPNVARRLVEAGANGLVLFNRFYQPDFDLEELEVVNHLVLSTSHEMRLPLRWIAMLYGSIKADFALTSGIHTSEDMIKAVMAGASATMVASVLLQNGIEEAREILTGVEAWMEEREYESITQMKGSMSVKAVAEPAAFERANYMRVLSSFDDAVMGNGSPHTAIASKVIKRDLASSGEDVFWEA